LRVEDRVLLITGPAGAGKSSVAEAWAASRDFACAQLSLDTFREFVKAGYHDPRNGWNDEAQRQLELARSNMAAAVMNYLSSGIQVVIDDAVFPNWDAVGLDGWNEALTGVTIDLVVLIPEWSAVVERNGGRDGQRLVPEDVLQIIYDDMAGWRDVPSVSIIDNSGMTVAETITEIERIFD
jgi:chloramphenicol 3-O-phosphotransferase